MDCIICANSNVRYAINLDEYHCLACGAIWKTKQFLSVKKARDREKELVKSFWAKGLLDLKPAILDQPSKPALLQTDPLQERLNTPSPSIQVRPAMPDQQVCPTVETGIRHGATTPGQERPDASPIIPPPIEPVDTQPLTPPRVGPARPLVVVELFCGKGTISKAFKSAGHSSFSVDIRKRKGVCEPDLRKDVLDLQASELPDKVDIVWASPPCDIWSYAAGGFHWDKDGQPKTEKAKSHILLLKKTLQLIDELRPAYFFIENPRGRMRNYQELIAWLDSHKAQTKTITLSSYGFPTQKPTNLFTNVLSWKPRPMDPFGRGAKASMKMDNLTKCSRQATPPALAQEIVEACEKCLTDPRPADEKLPELLHGPGPGEPAAQTTLPGIAPDCEWPAPLPSPGAPRAQHQAGQLTL